MQGEENTIKGTSFGDSIYNLFESTGKYIIDVFLYLLKLIGRLFTFLGLFIWDRSDKFRRNAFKAIKALGRFFAKPFLYIIRGYSRMKVAMQRAQKAEGDFAAVKVCFTYMGRFVFGEAGLLVTIFNIVLPVICVIFLFSLVNYATSQVYAVKLYVNGSFMGYIDNEQVFADAETVLDKRVNYFGTSKSINSYPSFAVEKIGSNETLNKYQVADLILQSSGLSTEYAYGVFVNDTFKGAVMDNVPIKSTLEMVLNQYKTNNPTEEIAFVDNVSIDNAGLYLAETIIETDELIETLTGTKKSFDNYTVKPNDSIEALSASFGVKENLIEAYNGDVDLSNINAGVTLRVPIEEPYLKVSVTKTEDYNVETQYSTEYYDDDSLFEGSTRVTTQGAPGKNKVTAKVSYVNGQEMQRNIISTISLTKPVTQRIAQGTKPSPEGTILNSSASYGHFIWPIANGGPGNVSEYTAADGGYRNHGGIDITQYYGAPIYAGASGVVVSSGWNGGYGKCVIIAHPDGYQTLYAHCESLYVKEGQSVTQGECIGTMGATGVVTGTHLHFEVRKGNTKLNPVKFLDGFQ